MLTSNMKIKNLLFIVLIAITSIQVWADDKALSAAIQSTDRTPQFTHRDSYRHPLETLRFFEVSPSMTVVEIWPGSDGWYTEILAPYLREKGKLYVAQFNADSSSQYYRESRQAFLEKIQSKPALYDRLIVTDFNPPQYTDIAPDNSVDRVLTFRNVHNWYMRGGGDERIISAFEAFYRALKPGGILGVVDHRLARGRLIVDQEESGYMHEHYIIEMAKKAGFILLDKSEINANAKDTTLHPKGVWTLPPSLRQGEQDKDKYLAIGESDRMTLKFQKPK